jgi:hypothetical protein
VPVFVMRFGEEGSLSMSSAARSAGGGGAVARVRLGQNCGERCGATAVERTHRLPGGCEDVLADLQSERGGAWWTGPGCPNLARRTQPWTTTPTTRTSRKSVCVVSARSSSFTRPRRYQVLYEENFDNTVVVDGVPIIDKSKLEKLLTKIAKEFSRKGAPVKSSDMFMPWDDSTGKSRGFVSCPPSKQAALANTHSDIFSSISERPTRLPLL